MLKPRWRKVLRDIWGSKIRTLLVVCSIALGVASIGSVVHMHIIVSRDIATSFEGVKPAHATLYAETSADTFDNELVEAVRRMDGVSEAEGQRSTIVRFRRDSDDEWLPMVLVAIDDYEDIRLNRIEPEGVYDVDPELWPGGDWPPPENELVIERSAPLVPYLGLTQAGLGDMVEIKTLDDKERSMRLAGLAYDFARMPSTFVGMSRAYVTFDTLEWLGIPDDYNELHIRVDNAQNTTYVDQISREVRDQIERSGRSIERVEIHPLGELPLNNLFQGLTLILSAMGILSLFLSVFLVANTVSALVAQQTRQIGVMKAVGAQTGQLIHMYLGMTFVFGLLALLIALPLGIQIASFFVGFLAFFLNFKQTAFTLPVTVLLVEIAVSLLVPLLAALVPVLAGARITIRQAISSHGVSDAFGESRIDQFLERLRHLPRPIVLSLRNTFRRKRRLLLTLVTMIVASVTFISVFSLRESMSHTQDIILEASRHDMTLGFRDPYRIERIKQIAYSVPGVRLVETWSSTGTYRVREDASESDIMTIIALPGNSQLFQPTIMAGRWLNPADENAVVVSSNIRTNEPDLDVGDWLTLKFGDDETNWRVVGFTQSATAQTQIYTNYAYYTRTVGDAGQTNSIRVVAETDDPATHREIVRTLQAEFENAGVAVTMAQTKDQQREQSGILFNILANFLIGMAVMIAIVGGLGLMGTMSLNVLERTREIGVLRAIGAGNNAITQIVIVEGIFIGLMSWAIGLLIALPLGVIFSRVVGEALLQAPLLYRFSVQGTLIWLVLVVVVAIVASMLPARNAKRMTVRETLAYE